MLTIKSLMQTFNDIVEKYPSAKHNTWIFSKCIPPLFDRSGTVHYVAAEIDNILKESTCKELNIHERVVLNLDKYEYVKIFLDSNRDMRDSKNPAQVSIHYFCTNDKNAIEILKNIKDE